jgi:hypothetical protein
MRRVIVQDMTTRRHPGRAFGAKRPAGSGRLA